MSPPLHTSSLLPCYSDNQLSVRALKILTELASTEITNSDNLLQNSQLPQRPCIVNKAAMTDRIGADSRAAWFSQDRPLPEKQCDTFYMLNCLLSSLPVTL